MFAPFPLDIVLSRAHIIHIRKCLYLFNLQVVQSEDELERFKAPYKFTASRSRIQDLQNTLSMKKNPTVVIKLGTSSIVHEKTHQPLLSILAIIVETAVALRKDGCKVVIVSSGAIGVALQMMNLPRRPKHLPQVQALAAIGQCRLIGLWDQLFERLGQPVAQILLTRNDIADRTQYQNAQNTFSELLHMGIIPIVNENDTISVAEIKFGDNDTLSAITAGMIQADYLFLMTDVDCLYDKNPRTNPDAKAIEVVDNISDLEADVSSAGSALGTGGMSTKIIAARLATAAGVTTIITKSSKPGNIHSIVTYLESSKELKRTSGNATPDSQTTAVDMPQQSIATSLNLASLLPTPPLHTRFVPSPKPIADRRFWLLHTLAPHGTVYVDHGAAQALSGHAGLLPVGVVDVDGSFAQQECVRIVEVTKPKNQRQASNPVVPTPSTILPVSTNPTPLPVRSSPLASGGIAIAPSLSRQGSSAGRRSPPPHVPSVFAHDPSAREIGRAIVNYSAIEIRRIAGMQSTEISSVLGYADTDYVAWRENVAILSAGELIASRPATPTFGGSFNGGVDGRAGVGGLGGYVEG